MTTEPLILNGNTVADEIKTSLEERIERLAEGGTLPCLATILVGDDPSSATYVRMKGNACKRLGIRSIHSGSARGHDNRGADRRHRRAQ